MVSILQEQSLTEHTLQQVCLSKPVFNLGQVGVSVLAMLCHCKCSADEQNVTDN